MKISKTFLLTDSENVSDVYSPILANIWNEEIILNETLTEILNWRMLHLFLKRKIKLNLADVTPFFKIKIKLLLRITDQ